MPGQQYTSVTTDKNGGNILIKVSCPNYPQSISGMTWEYSSPGTAPINSFSFTTANPESILGMPASTDQHLYFVDGEVLNQNDDPATQYQVQIEITQDGKQLLLVLQPPGGPGLISNKDIPISYRFQLKAA
ncbi:MAG: hypothetical protein ACHQM6_09615 [Candidatus Kapaibacterium sp.]